MRSKSNSEAAKRRARLPRPAGNGLYSRSSRFGVAARPSSSSSSPEVVHQQPHAHAAQRRVAQRAQEVAAGRVVLDVVVLHVERALRPARQFEARAQREVAGGHQAKAAQLRIRRGGLRDPTQRGGAGRLQRGGGRAGQAGGQGRATRCQERERE